MSIYEILIFCIAEWNIKVLTVDFPICALGKKSFNGRFILSVVQMYMIISYVIHSFTGNTDNPQIDPVPNMWFRTVPLLVEHHTGIADVINPLEALNFSKASFSNNTFPNWKNHSEDHLLLTCFHRNYHIQ